ncbi:hypothetical protein [Streptomyces sp. MZ04]|uniref:hypothetical protein n=1 Tax=Streptomyces sp. MZ04 TaxID=2559236 RepID=UPI00107E936E|nr:hypothetical protein [Streptomyces sp. MZ04]TGB03194.1 hypothetical protein E2651_25805 [Streptomyces sp. MZ04]
MGAPPQARRRRATNAERDEKIFKLKVRGLTERQIAAEVGLSQARVNGIIEQRIAAHLGPVVGDMVALRDAELHDLWLKAQAQYAATDDPDTRLKAINTLRGLNESRRKLHGADAPEAMTIKLDKRLDDEGADIAEVLLKVIPEVLAAVDLDRPYRDRLTTYALELAGWHLRAVEGDPGVPRPEAPRPQLALPPGASAGPPAPDPPPHRVEPDGADAVLAQLARFEDEFGGLDD